MEKLSWPEHRRILARGSLIQNCPPFLSALRPPKCPKVRKPWPGRTSVWPHPWILRSHVGASNPSKTPVNADSSGKLMEGAGWSPYHLLAKPCENSLSLPLSVGRDAWYCYDMIILRRPAGVLCGCCWCCDTSCVGFSFSCRLFLRRIFALSQYIIVLVVVVVVAVVVIIIIMIIAIVILIVIVAVVDPHLVHPRSPVLGYFLGPDLLPGLLWVLTFLKLKSWCLTFLAGIYILRRMKFAGTNFLAPKVSRKVFFPLCY